LQPLTSGEQVRKQEENIIDTGDEEDGFEEIIFTAPSNDRRDDKSSAIELRSFN
jgi:hypothetical protein